jgi:very-short-patch-repair endonuclease
MNARREIIPYDPELKRFARKLRNNSTLSERLLWNGIKNKQMKGYDFHRQKPLTRYIVDFYCNELRLAIEIDGDSHDYKLEEDQARQKELEGFGITFLRFDDIDVKKDVNNVLLVIEEWIEDYEEHTPGPSQEGRNAASACLSGGEKNTPPAPLKRGEMQLLPASQEGRRTHPLKGKFNE